jgi:UDP-GlcNAc:undecaprenyl-phosphate/decaprenyl-phosphate GlcNAc-1-phosphate transferase
MISFTNILIFHIFLNFVIFYFFDYLKQKINIYDYPNSKKKMHKKAIPLMGGLIFLFNLIFFLILKNLSLSILELNIILSSLFFLVIGVLDDKFDLSPYFKFLSLTIVLLIFFIFNEKMIINNVNIYNYNINFNKDIGIFFSILCVLLFVNAFNLFDGINLQSSSYGLFFLIFLISKGLFIEIILIIIIPLLLIIYLNNKNKTFMGDGGTLFLGSIMSLIVIANYTKTNSLTVEEIFLLMFLPGMDMLRLFIERIYHKKNPFMGDREHLHHHLLTLYGYKLSILLIFIISILPLLSNLFIRSESVIIFFIIFYFFLLFLVKKKISKKII